MNKLTKSVLLTGVSALLLMGTGKVMAQAPGGGGGGRNFDPVAMQQRMLDRFKETLKVTDDAEWKLLSEKIAKIMTISREMGGGFGGMMGGRRGGPGGGGQDAQADTTPLGQLNTALEGTDAAAIKTKLAAYRDFVAKKQTELEKAQADLKAIVTAKQEAQLVAMRILK
jgi:hypothetical protein